MATIEPLRPDDWTAAMQRVAAAVPPDQRPQRWRHGLHLLQTGVIDPRGVWVARRGNDIAGVQVCTQLAGSACLFWLPAADADCADALVEAGLQWARSAGCKFAQALASDDELSIAEPLLGHGFRAVTQLHQLRHDLGHLPDQAPPVSRFETYRPSLLAPFAATLERTYEGTLDCPELNGKRTIDEILAGHRGQGRFNADFWWLAYDGATPIGVVLLVGMPDELTWELAYLGIVPECRRRGLGRTLTVHAMQTLRSTGGTAMLVAVDGRNEPALRLYQSLGFRETERNHVLLCFW
jgi:ribosomal protein S18 acetylase RimI-like enzyme